MLAGRAVNHRHHQQQHRTRVLKVNPFSSGERLMTAGVATAAAAGEDLHELEHQRLVIHIQPGSDPLIHLFLASLAIILFTKCPYPSAGSESILKKLSNGLHGIFYRVFSSMSSNVGLTREISLSRRATPIRRDLRAVVVVGGGGSSFRGA